MKLNIQGHKLLLIVVFSTIVLVGKSQIRIGFTGGIGTTNQYRKVFSNELSSTNKFSFNIGMISEKEINKNLSISGELKYVVKGSKIEIFTDRIVTPTDRDTLTIVNNTLHYVEFPLDFVAKIAFQNNSKIAIGAGPYIAYGIAGKLKLDSDKSSSDPFKNGYQRMDFGGNIFLAYEISKIKISLSYSNGLTDITGGDDSYILRNRYGGLNVCYYFGRL